MESYVLVNNRDKVPWDKDMSVQILLDTMNYTWKMLVIKVNGQLVKKDQYTSTKVPKNADVKIIHLMSGG